MLIRKRNIKKMWKRDERTKYTVCIGTDPI